MPSLTQQERDLIYTLRYEEQRNWTYIYERFPNHLKSSLRHTAQQVRNKHGYTHDGVPKPRIEGVTLAEGDAVDEDEVWRLALQKSEKKRGIEEKKADAIIEFPHGPVCLAFFADQHAGSVGTDYARIDRDVQIVRDTPGMYAVQHGDIVNNFIIGKLQAIRFGAEFSICQEWTLAKRVLRMLAPKLLVSISGNHDLWTYALTGIDYLKEVHRELNPDILYAKYDMPFVLSVGGNEFRIRARHSWKGSSIYNDTHGIERASKFDKGREFDVGIGAHTHASGLYRQFNNGGKTGHAILCGSYKVYDDFTDRHGFSQSNESAAVAMVFSESGAWGTNDLEIAAGYMRTMYDG